MLSELGRSVVGEKGVKAGVMPSINITMLSSVSASSPPPPATAAPPPH